MGGKMSRRKGASYERELVHKFREVMPGCEVKRGLQGRGGAEVPDVDANPFWVECKRGRRPNIRGAMRQVLGEVRGGRVPVVVVRDDRVKEALVVIWGDDFDELFIGRVESPLGTLVKSPKPNIRTAYKTAVEKVAEGDEPAALIDDEEFELYWVLGLSDFLEMVRVWWKEVNK